MTNPTPRPKIESPSSAAVPVLDYAAPAPAHGHTAQKDKVPVLEKVMYGLGSGSFQLAADGVKGLSNSIFNITLGLSPSLIGLVLMISRLWDAFTDPVMGKISDSFRSRFGRRRPFIFVGSFLTGIAFVLIWLVPPGWSHTAIFWYYLIAMLLFYLCTTIQNVPYHTLGLEMTADYHERTVVSGYKMFFSFSFTLFLPWVFRLAQADAFGGTMVGIRFLSWFLAAAVVAGGVLPAIFVKERYYHIAKMQAKSNFWVDLKQTFSNRPFLVLTGIILCTGVGSGLVGPFGQYVIIYYIKGGDIKAGSSLGAMAANVSQVCSIICIPLMTLASKRMGKVRILWWLAILAVVGSLAKFVFYNKDLPILLFVSHIMLAPLAAGFWTLTTSMKADICDDDELCHGMRREGMYGAVGNWVMKATMATIFLISGVLLEVTGFHVDLKGNQAPQTLLWMRILFALIPAIFSFAGLVLLYFYPLTERRMGEIRAQLESRRAQVT